MDTNNGSKVRSLNLKLGPVRLYAHHLGDYMRRWIFLCPFGTIRLHNIMRPDADPDMHDHPFNFVSLILRGGYTEQVPFFYEGHEPFGPGDSYKLVVRRTVQELTYRMGGLNFCHATARHRISAVEPNTWTLVVTGPRLRKWGFWTGEGFVPWQKYLTTTTKGGLEAYAAEKANLGHQ